MPLRPCPPAARWRVLLPVKGGPRAKTRLGDLARRRPGLPEALALDALDAVLRCPRTAATWVVTADAAVTERAAAAGARTAGESAPGAGLLAALRDGLAAVAVQEARAGAAPVAVLLADLPCLRPEDLTAALDEAAAVLERGGTATVPDAEGTGTVLLAAAGAGALRPRFGPGSARAHTGDGAVAVGLGLPRLRRDVDTPEELAEAVDLGVGPRTSAALAAGAA